MGPENQIDKTYRVFNQSVQRISGAEDVEISQVAIRCQERIKAGELVVVGNLPIFHVPSITGFDLVEIAGGPVQMYAGVVVADIPKLMAASPENVDADLVRTLAIADQYPERGFQRRLRTVYEEALKLQTSWLEKTGPGDVEYDPRRWDKDGLIKDLLGEARFYSDCGFDDWKKAIEDHRKLEKNPGVVKELNMLENSAAHFMTFRQRYSSMNYQMALQAGKQRFIDEMGQDERALTTASLFMGISLYAKQPLN